MPEPPLDPGANAPLGCDLLIFDLDGTLIDSQQDLVESVNATLASLHRSPLESHRVASFIGDGAALLVQRALEATGGADSKLLATALSFFIVHYRAHMLDHTHAYAGVKQALAEIRAAAPSLPMAVLSNKPAGPSRALCSALGLSPFFFQVYGGDSFASKKPDPLGVSTLIAEASALGGQQITRNRTVLIGDSHVDIATARAAGLRCIGCSYGLDEARLRASAPDEIVDSPTQWFEALRQLSL